MRHFLRPGLLFLCLAAFATGCGSNSNSNPRGVNVKPDSRLQRMGEGGPDKGTANQNQEGFAR
jgi:hypothetical protein